MIRKHKYNAVITESDGFKFGSKLEAKRYEELKRLKKNGEVVVFLRQVPFHLPGNVRYKLDFLVMWADGRITFEDSKGCKTAMYKAKKKIVEALYAPITITEV